MCDERVKEEYKEELFGTKEENERQRQQVNVFEKPRNVHRAGLSTSDL